MEDFVCKCGEDSHPILITISGETMCENCIQAKIDSLDSEIDQLKEIIFEFLVRERAKYFDKTLPNVLKLKDKKEASV
jgi:hypothetical protein